MLPYRPMCMYRPTQRKTSYEQEHVSIKKAFFHGIKDISTDQRKTTLHSKLKVKVTAYTLPMTIFWPPLIQIAACVLR